MSSWARPGAKCVCIARGGRWVADEEALAVGPVAKRTYIVSGTMSDHDGVWLRLRGWGNDWFDAAMFRAVVDVADDVALFAHDLDTVGEPA